MNPVKPHIRYWYLVPVRIKYHYWSDGEESFVDTMLDIPMTDPFITDLQEATTDRNTTQEKVLQESLNALLVDVTHDLHEKLPPEVQQDCTITATITGPISYSKKPLD
jgi:maltodextrin utilization protein YvdJ